MIKIDTLFKTKIPNGRTSPLSPYKGVPLPLGNSMGHFPHALKWPDVSSLLCLLKRKRCHAISYWTRLTNFDLFEPLSKFYPAADVSQTDTAMWLTNGRRVSKLRGPLKALICFQLRSTARSIYTSCTRYEWLAVCFVSLAFVLPLDLFLVPIDKLFLYLLLIKILALLSQHFEKLNNWSTWQSTWMFCDFYGDFFAFSSSGSWQKSLLGVYTI